MSVRRERRKDLETGTERGFWYVDIKWKAPDGSVTRVRKVSPIQTKRSAEEYERQVREDLLMGRYGRRKEIPTFKEWFNGRYWQEWVVGRRNKPSTVEGKLSVYKQHLEARFGNRKIDEIKVGDIAAFRASLVEKGLTDKTINNILAVLSKPLHYAADVDIIPKAPKVGLFKVEAPEIEFWEFEQYARLLAEAEKQGTTVFAAVCLAGEAGLRVGEIKALRWREDVDMVAGTITVNQQMRKGVVGSPKGRTRRTVPMTGLLWDALKRIAATREGYVIRNLAGQAINDENQIKNLFYRVCRIAGLPERGWHSLRHTFGTHAALFGVNPWRLMTWMGHKRIDETMRYVHVADGHSRELPPALIDAAAAEHDPDRRILRMLGGRKAVPSLPQQSTPEGQHRGNGGDAHRVGSMQLVV
jgi:integrase